MSNWRDDARVRVEHEEHEASERALGHRETSTARDDRREALQRDGGADASEAASIERAEYFAALPEFRHTPAAERAPLIRIHTTPAEPAQPPETRMSVAQLRDRIRAMEATTRMKATEATEAAAHHYYPGEHRPRLEGPCARNERAEKLQHYRAELARRDVPAERLTAAQAEANTAAAAQVATAAELPPVPPATAADLSSATAKRAAVVAEIQATTREPLSKLDQVVEQLVREHSSGAVIDAAWAAGKRLFRPQGARV